MRILSAIIIAICLAAPFQASAKTPGNSGKAAASCRHAATEAERRHRIPAGLLNAIGLVESGRTLPGSRARSSWPWTVHAEGKGYWLDSRGEAIALVESLQDRGVENIDVGCFQVNLMYHPDAFDDLEAAFTPSVNAGYAASFLTELFQETRSWTRASAFYHSRTPERGMRYKKLVLAAWNGQASSARAAVRADVRARTGRNLSARRNLRVNRSTVYIQTGRNSIRIKRY